MGRIAAAALMAVALAGCVCGGSDTVEDRPYHPGQHYSGGTYVECHPNGAGDRCEDHFRDICHGDYDEVAVEHTRDYDRTADDRTRVAFCKD